MQATDWFMTGRPDVPQGTAPHGGRTLAEPTRFLAVAVIGLAVDLAIAWTLAKPLGIPLGIAATAGFAVAAAMNYALHELWTFQSGARRLSFIRSAQYIGVLGLTLAVRLAALAALVHLFTPERWTLVVLGFAASISFVVNYAVSKIFVFRRVVDVAKK